MSDPAPLSIHLVHPSLRLDASRIERLVARVLDGEGLRLEALSIVLADHATVLDLNRQYLGHDYLTDVLSFPLGEADDAIDGEVYVDLDTAAERCTEFDAAFEDEALRYVVHGLLHLAGYADADAEGKAEMHRLEDRYLAKGEGRRAKGE